MLDDEAPNLGVGFEIDTASAFGSLQTLDDAIGTAAADAVREFQKIEAASKSAVNLAGATAQVTTFANAETRELSNVARARASAEKSGEGMVRQMQRSVETFGKTTSEIRNMRAELRAVAAEEQGLTELAGRIRTLNAEMIRLESGQGGVTNAAVKNRMAMQGATYQVQDFFTQVSMGANPLNALAVQGGQLAGQFSSVEGKAGDVARFFMGPWGLAITVGVMVLGPLLSKLLETGNALDDAVDKLKKDAEATETNRLAKERFAQSEEGVAAAIRASTQASKDSAAEQISAAQRADAEAHANLRKEIATRRATQATLEAARAAEQTGPGFMDPMAPVSMQGQANDKVQALEAKIKEQTDLIKQAEARLNETRIGLAEEAAKRAADPSAALKKLYDDQINAAKDAARANSALTAGLAAQLGQIERNRAAAIKAEQDKQKAANETTRQIGRNIDLVEARQIAQSVGGRVTSDHRSRQEQEGLYAKYQAYKAGTGPWAALAAKPGTSNHELDQAIDVAKSSGVTLKKLIDAFRAAGVRVTEALDEGSHFHVAWAKVGDQAKQQTDARNAAAKIITDQKRIYDAAVKSSQDYVDAQKKAGDQTGMSAKEMRLYADAAAIAKAPTEALKQAIRDAAAEREKSMDAQAAQDFQKNVMQPLRDELSLYGLVGPARATAALELEKEGFIAQQVGVDIATATARWAEYYAAKKQLIGKDAEVEAVQRMRDNMQDLVDVAREAGDAMAHAFGRVGNAVSDAINVITEYGKRQRDIADDAKKFGWDDAVVRQKNNQNALQGLTALTGAAKNLFKEHSAGYRAMAAAEKVLAAIQLARTAIDVAGGAAKMFATLGPFAFPAVAAMLGVMASLGFSGGGSGGSKPPTTNTGTGTVLGGAADAKSESIRNAINALKDVDTVMLTYSRQMAASLRSIEDQIGGFASLILRTGDINANGGVTTGFKESTVGKVAERLVDPTGLLSKIPLVGGIFKGISNLIGSLFGTKTKVVGSGLFGGAQSLESILGGGFDAQYFSDIQKKKKFFGLTTSTKYSTQLSGADPELENQFTLILKSFNAAILAAAGPLGSATTEIQSKLNGFVVNLGKIDLQGLTGDEIEEKLNSVFGAAADDMAKAAFPFIAEFQKVGEGAFETLVRVSSTVETVTGTLDLLGAAAQQMGIAAKLGLADQFDSVSALSSAAEAYFQAFYTKEEQAAARTAQMADVFASLNLTMPSTLSGFRSLVEAQNLNTDAGRETYAVLLQLAPAFATLQTAMDGAKSAADIASEKLDLQQQLLELNGDTAALRALQLAKLDQSNRALQEQIYAIQDAQEAAKAAQELRDAWKSVGDSIMDEVNRIRGLSDTGSAGFAALMGQFNAATTSARGGDIDAAKLLPQLSQALITAAQDAATSRQELDRVRAQIAASLESTSGLVSALTSGSTTAALLDAGANSQAAAGSASDSQVESLTAQLGALIEKVEQMRSENTAGHAATAGNTGAIKKTLDNVTPNGDAIVVDAAA
jgi:hypothetical protein